MRDVKWLENYGFENKGNVDLKIYVKEDEEYTVEIIVMERCYYVRYEYAQRFDAPGIEHLTFDNEDALEEWLFDRWIVMFEDDDE